VIDQNAYIYVGNYLHINTMWNEMQKFDDIQLGAGEDRQHNQRGAKAQPRYFKMTSRGLLLFLLLMVGIVFAIINFILFALTENKDDTPTTSKRVVAEIVHRGFFDDEQVHLLMNSYTRLVPDDCEQHVGFEYDKQYNFSIFTLNSLCELNK
jgi:hypothetical protein